jgi:DNA-binding CsgD family transcriptional regulator
MRNTVAELRLRLARLELDRMASASALDRLQIGVIVADRSGMVLHANRVVRLLSERADPPLIVTGPANQPQLETSWFQARVAPLFQSDAPRRPPRPLVATHPIRSGGGHLHSLVAPLASGGQAGHHTLGDAVTIFVSDPDALVDMSEQVLRSLFAMTRTEARVAALLARGAALRELAAHLGMSPATARWHVKHLLGKTGTSSQRHLACVLLAGIASVRQD